MKANENYIYRCIAGEHILIPLGPTSSGKSGMYALSQTGGAIWQLIQQGKSRSEILASLLEEYDVSEEILAKDVDEFLHKLWSDGVLLELD